MSASNINNTLVSEIAEAAEALKEAAQEKAAKSELLKKSRLKKTPSLKPEQPEQTNEEARSIQRQIAISNNLHQIAELERLMKQHNNTIATYENLKTFKFNTGNEGGAYTSIEIKDMDRKSFQTSNQRLAQTLVECLTKILEDKIKELEEQILEVRIL